MCGIKVDINNSLKMQDEIKVREKLYQAIISQLQNDGYMAIAKNLILQVKPVNQCSPSDKLYEMFLQNQDQVFSHLKVFIFKELFLKFDSYNLV